ncbi:MAG TPA: tRNA guanosine(15) transglycosylase TgtA [Thermoplasmata archaeon]|nr:tRNA guanosine(15) transglycosylase TgtA [Thermoplasmata archaeon]
MTGFELLHRDGFARIGRFPTPHGSIETPALLPVVHPDPQRQAIPAAELGPHFGLNAAITSAYILWRQPELRAQAERVGLHRSLGFDGPLMTDSGAFQQHAYGHVEVGPEEILEFQGRIGSDIATVLDIFVETDATNEEATRGVEETSARAGRARGARSGLLAVPVQGGAFADLRYRSAADASRVGDLLAFGGVVSLLEQYRFSELAAQLLAARPALAPEKPLHLFGAGHPVVFAFAALFGVDLFDSSSYHKFARRGAAMFPEGTVPLDSIREAVCDCRACRERPLPELARLEPAERERGLARHNLAICALEIARVRQAIRDGTLWELAERRAAGHPALAAGLRTAIRGARQFAVVEPDSRDSFRWSSALSTLRPAVIRFLARMGAWKIGRGPVRFHPRIRLTPASLRSLPSHAADERPIAWEAPTPIGPVPIELLELYPVGCWLGPEEFEPRAAPEAPDAVEPDPAEDESRRLDRWTERHITGLFRWMYGSAAAEGAATWRLAPIRSPRTGRLRRLDRDGATWFVVRNDGLLQPTWAGGQALHALLPSPQGRVRVLPDAVPFVEEGRTLFSSFAAPADVGLSPGASALLVDEGDRLLAVGRLLLAPGELGRFRRGLAATVLSHARAPLSVLEPEPPELPGEESPPGRP